VGAVTPDVPARGRAVRTAAWAYGAAAVAALLLRPGLRALLVPLAGPWAARVYGHG
jgi:hypothetical protein